MKTSVKLHALCATLCFVGLLARPAHGETLLALACVVPSDYSSVDILDERLPAEAKRTQIEKLKTTAADPGCHEARYLLGHLYRHGSDLPGNPVPKDTAEARRLIEAFALRGNAWAFADLAELAIAEKQGREAIKWTQVYLYLLTRTDAEQAPVKHDGYAVDLLLRTQEVARKTKVRGQHEAARAELNAYLTAQRDLLVPNRQRVNAEASQFVAQLSSGGGASHEQLRVRSQPTPERLDLGRLSAGYAVYLMEVQPDGRVSRIVPASFAPTVEHAKRLRKVIEGWEFHPHRGAEPIVLRVPVNYGYDGGAQLKVPGKG